MSLVSTSLKLSPELKQRIQRLAERSNRSAHSFMVEALEREVEREERLADFVQQALKADGAIEQGAEVYGAEDVHQWLTRLAEGKPAKRPKACRR